MIYPPVIMGIRARKWYARRIKELDAEMDEAQVRNFPDPPELAAIGWTWYDGVVELNHSHEMERTDPEPRVGPFCRCASCLLYYIGAAK